MARPGYHDDDEGNHAVIYFGGPIVSGYVSSGETTSPTWPASSTRVDSRSSPT